MFILERASAAVWQAYRGDAAALAQLQSHDRKLLDFMQDPPPPQNPDEVIANTLMRPPAATPLPEITLLKKPEPENPRNLSEVHKVERRSMLELWGPQSFFLGTFESFAPP